MTARRLYNRSVHRGPPEFRAPFERRQRRASLARSYRRASRASSRSTLTDISSTRPFSAVIHASSISRPRPFFHEDTLAPSILRPRGYNFPRAYPLSIPSFCIFRAFIATLFLPDALHPDGKYNFIVDNTAACILRSIHDRDYASSPGIRIDIIGAVARRFLDSIREI